MKYSRNVLIGMTTIAFAVGAWTFVSDPMVAAQSQAQSPSTWQDVQDPSDPTLRDGKPATQATPQATTRTGDDKITVKAEDKKVSAEIKKLREQVGTQADSALQLVRKQADESLKKVDEAQLKASQERQAAVSNRVSKLETAALRICQTREQAIGSALGRVDARGKDRVRLIDTVSQRIQVFYTGQQVELAQYDSLLDAVNSARTAAQAATESVDAASGQFGCEVADPKGAVQSFKRLHAARDDAIKTYRDAVKQLAGVVKGSAQLSSAEAAQRSE